MQKSKKADDIISAPKETFARYWIPEKVRSDNGPPFDCAQFTHFAKQWDIAVLGILSPTEKSRDQCRRLRTF